MIVYARAKINLALQVNERRSDGFHNIETLFTQVDLKDRIAITPSPRLIVDVRPRVAPPGPENLAYRAAMELSRDYGIKESVRINIQKNIPVGGGLGGGSADAAAVIKALITRWKIKAKPRELGRILARLGSDVPFCFQGGTALGTGRGERLRALPSFPRHHVVLVNPGLGVSTRLAYGDLGRDLTPPAKKVRLYKRYSTFLKGKAPLKSLLHNDFEATVFKRHPPLLRIRKEFELFHPEGALMSGSGATVYGLFKDRRRAAAAAAYFKRKGLWTCHTRIYRGLRAAS